MNHFLAMRKSYALASARGDSIPDPAVSPGRRPGVNGPCSSPVGSLPPGCRVAGPIVRQASVRRPRTRRRTPSSAVSRFKAPKDTRR
jgi:hypothetical protein